MGRKGFTLAEVLITLVIIGVIAALTIPTLIKNNQKKEWVTGLKKFYATTNQILIRMAADAGCIGNLNCVTDEGYAAFGDRLASYYKLNQNCRDASDNVACGWADAGAYRFITADGMTVKMTTVMTGNPACINEGHPVGTHMAGVCAKLGVDVNGTKGPNIFGRDIFFFYITNGKGPMLYPYGGEEDIIGEDHPADCSEPDKSNIESYTGGCANRIIKDGWEMNY